MEDGDSWPILICCKKLKPEFNDVQKIQITSDDFSLGRGLRNSAVIPFLSISRNHCVFKKNNENVWNVVDNSTFGIKINGIHLGKGLSKTLSDGDIISLEQTEEFVYKFRNPTDDVFQVPRKRMKMEDADKVDNNIINNMKIKFEESQTHEIEHIEQKLKNVKQMQTTSMILKKHLHSEMNSRLKQLEIDYTTQIENLKGEKNEIERQKAILVEERDAQLASIKCQMEEKIAELMDQVHKHNETETELLKENSLLKEKLEKEREEFLAELSRENSSKKDILEKLEAKIREQEEVRAREREEALQVLHREMERLKHAKEKQIKEIQDQRNQREIELKTELDCIRHNLQEKVLQSEQEKLKAEQLLSAQIEHMKKLSDEEKVRMETLMKEREEIQNKLTEAQTNAAKSIAELASRVTERETELAALAAERIQKQAEQSSEVISTLQQQLEKVKSQLQTVETEKNTILESICAPENSGEGSSKQTVLTEVGEIMENELQCSICAELFVSATTLNCSHTFCRYCINMWKKKKKDCPICRSPIISECKSLVLDTFIEKMVQNLSEGMKRKRIDILKSRQELESELARQTDAQTSRRGNSSYDSDERELSLDEEEGEGEEESEEDLGYFGTFPRRHYYDYYSDDSDGGSDDDPFTETDGASQPDESDSTTSAGSHSVLHGFPNPEKNPELFRSWIYAVGGDILGLDNHSIYKRRRVCRAHFEEKYCCRFNRISTIAVPTLNLPERGPGSAATDSRGRRRGVVEGLPDAYYGGYGRCYRCGARGHWAPGCPFR